MIKQTTEIERQKRAMLKMVRSLIRLKHSLAADEEIGRTLPEVEARIDNALATGQPLELLAAEFVNEVEPDEA